jgi:hypothetical protein
MRRILTSTALATLAIAAGIEAAPASAQQGPVYAPPQPAAAYAAAARPTDPRAVLPAFSRRGGVGTTPYLGNTRGLGAFSTNYDAPPRMTTAPAYPVRRGGLFSRWRNRR